MDRNQGTIKMTYPNNEIPTDKKYYVPAYKGEINLPLSATTEKQAIKNANKEGLIDYEIETFWGSEFE